MVKVVKKDGVITIYLPLSFSYSAIREVIDALTEAEQQPGATAVVLASDRPKIWNAGLDLKELRQHGKEFFTVLFIQLSELLCKLLSLSVPSIAAISGHAIAGGCLVAIACDHRIMAEDVGVMNMNELDNGVYIPRVGAIVLRRKLDPAIEKELSLDSKKLTGPQCLQRRIVDAVAPRDQVLAKAEELAKKLAPFGELKENYALHKQGLYEDLIRELETFTRQWKPWKESKVREINPKL